MANLSVAQTVSNMADVPLLYGSTLYWAEFGAMFPNWTILPFQNWPCDERYVRFG
jgi:hypothetical protein